MELSEIVKQHNQEDSSLLRSGYVNCKVPLEVGKGKGKALLLNPWSCCGVEKPLVSVAK